MFEYFQSRQIDNDYNFETLLSQNVEHSKEMSQLF